MSELSCKCEKCIECCWHNPGWFGSMKEIIGAAKIINKTIREFCQEYLIQEWWADNKENISIPAPRRNFERDEKTKYKGPPWDDEIKRNGKGFVRATWGHNLITGYPCIFLDENNLCIIYKNRPIECKKTFGCRKNKFKGREKLVNYWRKHQDFIEEAKNDELKWR